jgi:hypothetical protein
VIHGSKTILGCKPDHNNVLRNEILTAWCLNMGRVRSDARSRGFYEGTILEASKSPNSRILAIVFRSMSSPNQPVILHVLDILSAASGTCEGEREMGEGKEQASRSCRKQFACS